MDKFLIPKIVFLRIYHEFLSKDEEEQIPLDFPACIDAKDYGFELNNSLDENYYQLSITDKEKFDQFISNKDINRYFEYSSVINNEFFCRFKNVYENTEIYPEDYLTLKDFSSEETFETVRNAMIEDNFALYKNQNISAPALFYILEKAELNPIQAALKNNITIEGLIIEAANKAVNEKIRLWNSEINYPEIDMKEKFGIKFLKARDESEYKIEITDKIKSNEFIKILQNIRTDIPEEKDLIRKFIETINNIDDNQTLISNTYLLNSYHYEKADNLLSEKYDNFKKKFDKEHQAERERQIFERVVAGNKLPKDLSIKTIQLITSDDNTIFGNIYFNLLSNNIISISNDLNEKINNLFRSSQKSGNFENFNKFTLEVFSKFSPAEDTGFKFSFKKSIIEVTDKNKLFNNILNTINNNDSSYFFSTLINKAGIEDDFIRFFRNKLNLKEVVNPEKLKELGDVGLKVLYGDTYLDPKSTPQKRAKQVANLSTGGQVPELIRGSPHRENFLAPTIVILNENLKEKNEGQRPNLDSDYQKSSVKIIDIGNLSSDVPFSIQNPLSSGRPKNVDELAKLVNSIAGDVIVFIFQHGDGTGIAVSFDGDKGIQQSISVKDFISKLSSEDDKKVHFVWNNCGNGMYAGTAEQLMSKGSGSVFCNEGYESSPISNGTDISTAVSKYINSSYAKNMGVSLTDFNYITSLKGMYELNFGDHGASNSVNYKNRLSVAPQMVIQGDGRKAILNFQYEANERLRQFMDNPEQTQLFTPEEILRITKEPVFHYALGGTDGITNTISELESFLHELKNQSTNIVLTDFQNYGIESLNIEMVSYAGILGAFSVAALPPYQSIDTKEINIIKTKILEDGFTTDKETQILGTLEYMIIDKKITAEEKADITSLAKIFGDLPTWKYDSGKIDYNITDQQEADLNNILYKYNSKKALQLRGP